MFVLFARQLKMEAIWYGEGKGKVTKTTQNQRVERVVLIILSSKACFDVKKLLIFVKIIYQTNNPSLWLLASTSGPSGMTFL